MMADEALSAYLNDHLAGSTVGAELAAQIRDRSEHTPLGEMMSAITLEIEEDRDALLDLMKKMNVPRSSVKQAAGWLAEKVGRVKFAGLGAGSDHGLFMALESLTLGVNGKACLWRALKEVESDHPPLAAIGLDNLITRANEQRDALERERLATARQLLS